MSMRRADAEFDIEPEKMKEAYRYYAEAGPYGNDLYRRLDQGTVPRDQYEKLYGQLVEHMTDLRLIDRAHLDYAAPAAAAYVDHSAGHAPAYVPTPTYKAPSTAVHLSLFTDKSTYHYDEPVTVKVQSNHDCYLTLIDITVKGNAGTVLLPNPFQKDNLIHAGEALQFPPVGSKYTYNVKPTETGGEQILAICDAVQVDPLSIISDYKNNAFTSFTNASNRAIEIRPVKNANAGERDISSIKFDVR